MDPETPQSPKTPRTRKPRKASAKQAPAPKKTGRKTSRKTAPKKKAAGARKVAPRKTAPRAPKKATSAEPVSGPRTIPAEERHRMIAEAAYFRAERRGFAPGDPELDWRLAEAEIDAKLLREARTTDG